MEKSDSHQPKPQLNRYPSLLFLQLFQAAKNIAEQQQINNN